MDEFESTVKVNPEVATVPPPDSVPLTDEFARIVKFAPLPSTENPVAGVASVKPL